MTGIGATCPTCRHPDEVEPRAVLVALANGTAGQDAAAASWICSGCGTLATLALDDETLSAVLRAGGGLLDLAAPEHPERPPAGPALCLDDLLDLHAELEDDAAVRWSCGGLEAGTAADPAGGSEVPDRP